MEFKTPELGHRFLPLALDSEPIVHIAEPHKEAPKSVECQLSILRATGRTFET